MEPLLLAGLSSSGTVVRPLPRLDTGLGGLLVASRSTLIPRAPVRFGGDMGRAGGPMLTDLRVEGAAFGSVGV